MESVQSWLVPILISVVVPGGVAVLLRLIPKKRLMGICVPASNKAGAAISKILMLRLGRKAAESVEEGVFVTLATVLYASIDSFMKGLLSDNTPRKIETTSVEGR